MYLWNYKVKDNYYFDRCLSDNSGPRLERDNIKHSLFSCPLINPFLDYTLNFFINDCNFTQTISEVEYLLGFQGKKFDGLNCALLELKKFIFYNFSSQKSLSLQFTLYLNRLRRIIILDKKYYLENNKIELFYEK